MNTVKKIILIIHILFLGLVAHAQDTPVGELIKQGVELNNARDYAGAIEKYKQALSTEPDNPQANYQMAFTLSAAGKGTEGIPYLNKTIATSNNFTGPAYELLGSIYDAAKQPQQAIDAYKAGIKIKP